MKMKNVVENLFLLFAIGVIVWIICSYVNIVTNNDTVQTINNYADWNAFAIFSKIIKWYDIIIIENEKRRDYNEEYFTQEKNFHW